VFLIVKATQELHSAVEGENGESKPAAASGAFWSIIAQIILIDMVFSFDSIITAVGMANHVEVMAAAVIVAMVIMFYFADSISRFIHRHPTLKMLALSFLLMVGFSLFFEGLEPMHGSHIDKGYIYVAMAFSFGVELLNMRLRKKMDGKPAVELREPHA